MSKQAHKTTKITPKMKVLAKYPNAICSENRYGYVVWANPGESLEVLAGTEEGEDPVNAMQAWAMAARRLDK